MAPIDELERRFFEALRALHLEFVSGSLDYPELLARCDAIEAEYPPLLESAGKSDESLAVRRRIAEDRLTMAMEYGRSADECRELFERVRTLGFESLYSRSSTTFAFCGFWSLQGGHDDMVMRYVEPLVRDLEAERARTGAEYCDAFLRDFATIRERVSARARRDE